MLSTLVNIANEYMGSQWVILNRTVVHLDIRPDGLHG